MEHPDTLNTVGEMKDTSGSDDEKKLPWLIVTGTRVFVPCVRKQRGGSATTRGAPKTPLAGGR